MSPKHWKIDRHMVKSRSTLLEETQEFECCHLNFACGSLHQSFCEADPFELGLGVQIKGRRHVKMKASGRRQFPLSALLGDCVSSLRKPMLYAGGCRPSPSRELPAARSGSAEIMRVGELNFSPVACLPDQPSISSQIPVDMRLTSLPHFLMVP